MKNDPCSGPLFKKLKHTHPHNMMSNFKNTVSKPTIDRHLIDRIFKMRKFSKKFLLQIPNENFCQSLFLSYISPSLPSRRAGSEATVASGQRAAATARVQTIAGKLFMPQTGVVAPTSSSLKIIPSSWSSCGDSNASNNFLKTILHILPRFEQVFE